MDNLSSLTTLKIGGPVKKIISVQKEADLISALHSSLLTPTSYLIIGSGSNLLVSDKGFDGTVIKNEIVGIKKQGNNLIVKSGTILLDLVNFANNDGLSGLENLAGIPGTLGGAIYGNAGAYGQTISDHLVSVKVLDAVSFQLSDVSKQNSQFNYRDSIFKRNEQALSSSKTLGNKSIILEATFSLAPADPKKLIRISQETIKKREVKYPPGIKCPGSFFKNIPEDSLPRGILDKLPKESTLYGKVSAGALLESVGAKGAREGNIKIADYHANLFVNEGGGTAEDFYTLAKTYSQKVFEKYGIRLEPEVQLINLPSLS